MCDFVSLFLKNYEENADYTRVAKTRFNARVHAIINLTSKLAVIFFVCNYSVRYKISFSRKFLPYIICFRVLPLNMCHTAVDFAHLFYSF